jgi:hypothetical protein
MLPFVETIGPRRIAYGLGLLAICCFVVGAGRVHSQFLDEEDRLGLGLGRQAYDNGFGRNDY